MTRILAMLALIFQNAATEIVPTSTKPAVSPPFQSLCTASANAHSDQAYFGELTEKEGLRRDFVLPTDYPIKAMRTGLEGAVSLRVLTSPEGRIVHSSVIGQADQQMAEMVQVVATRRLRKLHFDGQPCRYVWARLPNRPIPPATLHESGEGRDARYPWCSCRYR